jgi:hypothetical protein
MTTCVTVVRLSLAEAGQRRLFFVRATKIRGQAPRHNKARRSGELIEVKRRVFEAIAKPDNASTRRENCAMPSFRCYCLNEDGRIAIARDIDAPDLLSAIRSAHEECSTHPAGPFTGIEVWQGARRLFTSKDASPNSPNRSC